MIFEDLTQTGYKNVNRKYGLNIEYFKIVLSKVAKWHATTAVLMQKVSNKGYIIILFKIFV